MIIREAKIYELDELVRMALQFEREYIKTQLSENSPYTSLNETAEDKIRKDLNDAFSSKDKKFIVAEKDGKIIGYVIGAKIKWDGIYNVKKIGKINFLYVKKEFRGQGIASKLFKEAIKFLKEKGINYVSLMASSKNKAAILAYKKWGFEAYELEFLKKI